MLVDTAGFGNRAATVAMTSADAVLVPTLAREIDITNAEQIVRLVEDLAGAARRDIPTRVPFNRVRRTTLFKHADTELTRAKLKRLDASLSNPWRSAICLIRAGSQQPDQLALSWGLW